MTVKPITPFENVHRFDRPSTTSLAMFKYPRLDSLGNHQKGHMAHIDVESLTFLFTSSPGLEVLCLDQSWVPICPSPYNIFIIVGDTLKFMSRQKLHSCLHRVISNIQQDGAFGSRFSIAFFLRSELIASFIDGEGREWTDREWHLAKYKIFRADDFEQSKCSLLTDSREYLGKRNVKNNEM